MVLSTTENQMDKKVEHEMATKIIHGVTRYIVCLYLFIYIYVTLYMYIYNRGS